MRAATRKLEAFQAFLARPLRFTPRILLVVSIAAVYWVFTKPLWTMSFESNQYTDPLRMTIHIHHLEGQKTELRDDLREINSLNHYIGMRPLLESDFSEFVWMPFVVGAFALLCLRAAALGTIRDLVDLVVLFIYFGAFSAWTFWHRLYMYGHNLDPEAPIKVQPFTPPMMGREKIANFWVESQPAGGSYALAVFATLVILALAITLLLEWRDRRQAARAAT